MTRRPLFVAALAVQVAIPTVALFHGVPSMFGFHMFARTAYVQIAAYDAEGDRIPLELGDWIVGRPELDWPSVLPQRMCAALDDAHRVVVSDQDRTVQRTC